MNFLLKKISFFYGNWKDTRPNEFQMKGEREGKGKGKLKQSKRLLFLSCMTNIAALGLFQLRLFNIGPPICVLYDKMEEENLEEKDMGKGKCAALSLLVPL